METLRLCSDSYGDELRTSLPTSDAVNLSRRAVPWHGEATDKNIFLKVEGSNLLTVMQYTG